MKNAPLISVIVPVYRIETFLDKCIQSIVSQTYTNLEIILVDDGSTDNCGKICDEWAKNDDRIVVVHKNNGGLSDARNVGLSKATGDLIGFVDGDDYIRNDMYELLYNSMITNNSDISMCGVLQFWEDGKTASLTKKGTYVIDNENAVYQLLNENAIKQPVWYKLYKRNVIKDVLFPVGKLHEDILWSLRVIGNAKRVSVVDEECYFYRQRSQSIMGAKYTLRRLDSISAKLESVEYIETHFPQYNFIAKSNLWFSCIYAMQRVLLDLEGEDKKIGRQIIIDAFNHKRITFHDIMSVRGKQRIWLLISRVSLTLVARIKNLLKIGL